MHKEAISNHSRGGWSIWAGVPCGYYTFLGLSPISTRGMRGFHATRTLDFRFDGSLIVASEDA